MKRKYVILVITCILIGFKGISQDSIRTGSWLNVNVHYGIIMPAYSQDMALLVKAHVPAIEINYIDKPNGNKTWQQDFHYAETGLSFFYAWLGNPTQLGNEIGLYPFINFHLQRSCKEYLYLRAGLGLAYLPVTFNQQTNHKDVLIGTHLNTIINLRLNYHYYISQNLRLETGFGIMHCSNGSFSTPNLGINLLTINTGLSYGFTSHKVSVLPPTPDTVNHKGFSHEFFAGVGVTEIEPPGGSRYSAMTLTYIAYHTLNKKNRIGAGFDIFYNNANFVNIAADSIPIHSRIENTQLGFKVGYELTIGRLAFPYELGVYLYTKSRGHGYEYNRLGLRYNITKHVIANLSLLAHFASADYVEWGFGYKI